MINTPFLIRVSCMTFNHVSYIEDAMNGFCLQETSFPFVCTIVDDASTDGAQDVIKTYLQRYFDLDDESIVKRDSSNDCERIFAQHKNNKNCYFAVVFLKYNHYSIKKSKIPYFHEWLDTKYIAICEGDDYWTSPKKLQKQVDYLEDNPDCCMCAHAAYWEREGVRYLGGCQYVSSHDLTTDEVIRNGGLYLSTNSLIFRSWLFDDRPEWRKKSFVGDYPLQILGTLRGRLHFLPDTMSVYRFMAEGSWTARQFGYNRSILDWNIKYTHNEVDWLSLLDKDTQYQFTGAIHTHLFKYYRILFFAKEIQFFEYCRAAMKADEKHIGRVCKDFIIRYFRSFYKVIKKDL